MGDIKKQVFLKIKQTSRWCAGHRGNQAFDEEVVYLVILCIEFWLQQKIYISLKFFHILFCSTVYFLEDRKEEGVK